MIARLRNLATGHRRGAFLFGLVGFLNFATDFAVFLALIWLGVHPAIANVMSFACANVQSYRVNAAVTFRREGRSAPVSHRSYAKFAAAHVLGLAISTAFILALSDAIGPFAAKAVSVIFSAGSNYCLSARFVFRQKKLTKPGADDL